MAIHNRSATMFVTMRKQISLSIGDVDVIIEG